MPDDAIPFGVPSVGAHLTTLNACSSPSAAVPGLKVPLISGSGEAHIGTTMLTMIEQEPHFLNQRTPPTATIAIVPISDHAAAPKHGQLAYFNTLKISHKNEESLEGGEAGMDLIVNRNQKLSL